MYDDGDEPFDDFPPMPWAEDPVGYWHFEPDDQCSARFASGLTWKEPGDLLHVEVAGQLNARWAGSVTNSQWEAPAFATVESLSFERAPLRGGPPGLYTSRGIVRVTRVEAAGAFGGQPSPSRPWVLAALVHGDGDDLYQSVTVVTGPAADGRAPLALESDAAVALWAEAGVIGIDAFRRALGV